MSWTLNLGVAVAANTSALFAPKSGEGSGDPVERVGGATGSLAGSSAVWDSDGSGPFVDATGGSGTGRIDWSNASAYWGTPLTIGIVYRMASGAPSNAVLASCGTYGVGGWYIQAGNGAPTLIFSQQVSGTTRIAMSSDWIPYDGAWHHLLVTVDNGSPIRMWIDGTEVSYSSQDNGGTMASTSDQLRVGCYSDASLNVPADWRSLWILKRYVDTGAKATAIYDEQIGGFPTMLTQGSLFRRNIYMRTGSRGAA